MRDSYCHRFHLDKPIRMATDNVVGYISYPEYSPTPPPAADFFLLSDTTNLLLSDAEDFLLS